MGGPNAQLAPDETPFLVTGDFDLAKGFEAGDGDLRFIATMSSESRDADGEILLQNGLEWAYFLKGGWFNDNHGSGAGDGIGVPVGQPTTVRLPSGILATRCEGVLFDTPRGRDVWNLSKAAAKYGRRLGCSIEGGIAKRLGADGKTVAKAFVRDCAITRHPKNADTTLEVLVKALKTGEVPASWLEREGFAKAKSCKCSCHDCTKCACHKAMKSLTAGYGDGTGAALMPQSLDGSASSAAPDLDVLNDAEAIAHIMYRLDCNKGRASQIYREIRGGGF